MKINLIIMAAGKSSRFLDKDELWQDKLLMKLGNETVVKRFLGTVSEARKLYRKKHPVSGADDQAFVVTRNPEILSLAENYSMVPVFSPESINGAAYTIRNGIRAAGEDGDYYMFLAADQPLLSAATIVRMLDEAETGRASIISMGSEAEPANPVIFHRRFIPELLALKEDQGGRRVAKKHPSDLIYIAPYKKEERLDCDTKEQLLEIERILNGE